MEDKEILRKIKLLKAVEPTEEWVLSCRAKLAFRMEMSRKKDLLAKDTFALKELFSILVDGIKEQPSFQWVHSLIIAVIVVLGGGAITSWAAVNSLPGSPLYPVKLAIEKARVSASLSEESRLELQVKLADARLQELDAVVKSQDNAEQKAEKLSQVAASIQDQLTVANVKSKTVIEPKKALATAKIVSDRATQASRALAAAKDSLPDEVKPEVKLKLNEATEAVEKTGIAALEALIINQGISSSTKEEIIAKLDEEIKLVESRVKIREQKIADSRFFADRLPIRAVLINQFEQVLELLDKAKEALAKDDAAKAIEMLKAARAINSGAEKMTQDAVLPEVKGATTNSDLEESGATVDNSKK